MKELEHTKIIHRIAKEVFTPYQIIRKGQSRTYHDDHGWYTTIIEFQPSGFGRGTYLNVGVSFHWNLQEYFSFDIGYRQKGFVEYIDEAQFSLEVKKIAKVALDNVLYFRKELSTLEFAKKFIIDNTSRESIWGDYHSGVICGLSNDVSQSSKYFNYILKTEDDIDWANKLKLQVNELIKAFETIGNFKHTIIEIIHTSRKLKKLPPIQIKF